MSFLIPPKLRSFIAGSRVAAPLRWLNRTLRLVKRGARLNRNYDRWTVDIMARVLRDDSNAIDVGCHRGSMLQEIIRCAPNGAHHAFEPLPEMAATLRQRFPTVTIHEAALSDSAGTATFRRVVDRPAYSGLRERDYPDANVRIETITVETAKLDDALPEGFRVDFVKVDVEGGELGVFRGATRLLSRCKPVVVFEHGLGAAEHYGTRPEAVYDLLEECGLRLSLLNDWLRGSAPLTRERFIDEFDQRRNFYFVAHPER